MAPQDLYGLPGAGGVGPVLTQKSGSGAGNYSTTSTGYVDIDGTNLAYTVTVPSGQKIMIACSGAWACSGINSDQTVVASIALTDGATLLRELTMGPMGTAAATNVSLAGAFAINYIVLGDGGLRTFKLRWKISNGIYTLTMKNATSTDTPTMNFWLGPAS